MKKINAVVFLAMMAVLAALPLTFLAQAQNNNRAEVQFQAAQHKAFVDGDLKGAIEQYKQIASGRDRAMAAKALVAMAECYEKLGDGESRTIYERVLREYGEQKEAVTLARAKLGGGAQPRRQTNTLVLSGPNVDSGGRVSPDGRYLSYTDWDSGDLALHEIATGTDRRLTDTGQKGTVTVYAEGSAISRDGKQVAYNWYDENTNKAELRLASLSGDPNPRRLYDNPDIAWFTPYDWSPDGKWVAVDVTRKDRTRQIGLVSVQDGSLHVLKSVDWRGAVSVFFSPDGNYLGYDLPESDTSQERDVFVLAIDGTRETPAIVHRGQDFMMGWSPDGKRLLFRSDRTGSMGLWGLPFADGKPQGVPELIKADIGPAGPLGLTSSGALYYAITTGDFPSNIQLASIDFDAGKIISSATDVLPQEYLKFKVLPLWSPDGKYLAYASGPLGRRGPWSAIFVIRSAETGQVVRELQVGQKLSYFSTIGFSWAPDSRSFLTQGIDFKGRSGAFEVDAQTGDASPIRLDQPGESSLSYPTWSPDGKSLYFLREISRGNVSALFHLDLASGKEREVFRRAWLSGLDFSPDGQSIVTRSVDRSTNSRILLLIPVAGGEPRELMREASEAAPGALTNGNRGQWLAVAHWAPDSGSFLAYKIRPAADRPNSEVWRIPIGGDEPRKLDVKLNSFNINDRPRVHPDGRRIAYTVAERVPRTNEVWVLENFLPALNAKK